MNKIQVVLIENLKYQDDIINYYKKIFKRLGYDSNFIQLSFSQTNEGVDHHIENMVVDIIISDLSLGTEEGTDGLDLIRNIKIEYPEIYVIANSSKMISHTDVSSRYPSFDLYVSKKAMLDDDFTDYYSRMLKKSFKKNINMRVDFDNSRISDQFESTQSRIILEQIVRMVTFTSHNVDMQTVANRAILETLDGGNSGSDVYKLKTYTQKGLQCINSVLKISPIKDALKELENYQKYVKWYLPYTWRAELIGYGFTKELGALCYSFAYNDDIPFESLSYHISKKDNKKVFHAIDYIFTPDYQRWYHENNVSKNEEITKYFHKKWFKKDNGNEGVIHRAFKKVLSEYNLGNNNFVEINSKQYPMPEVFLFSPERGDFHTCLCHGDLNSNNILLTEKNDLIFIDFQHTGRGHVFEDFVTLECSLRFYSNFDMSFDDLIKEEICLIDDNKSKLPFADHMNKLRHFAKDTMKAENFDHYYYTLSLCCYRLFRIKKLEEWQKQQLAACVIANIGKLKSLEN